jgi:hypothetical protein
MNQALYAHMNNKRKMKKKIKVLEIGLKLTLKAPGISIVTSQCWQKSGCSPQYWWRCVTYKN